MSGSLTALVLLLVLGATSATFTAQTSNSGNAFTAASLDSWTPLSASATRTGPTTCLVSWSARASPPATLTYDVTDGAGGTLATAVSGTSVSVTVPTSAITPTVRARATGWVSAAETTSSMPCAGVPSAPTALTATPGDAQAALTWAAPADTGGSPITGYTATAVPADGTLPTRVCTAASSPCTVTALTNGVTYTVTVTATNAVGTGAASTSVTAVPYPAAVMSTSALRLWLDGADPATMFQNTTATTPATTAGQSVARWNDKSGKTDGSGINFAQSTVSTERPALSTVNGHLVPTFDGTSDYLGLRSVSMLPVGTTTSTIFAVATMTGDAGSTYQTLFEYGTASNGASRTIYKNAGNADDIVDAYVIGWVSDGTWSASPTISTAEFASANVKMWHAGRPQQSAAGAFNTGTAFADIGRETTNGYYWQGAVPELIVVDTVLSSAQRRSVEEYLARKWGSLITPDAPTAVTATAASTSAAVSWTTPAWNGGAAITGYTVTASPGPGTCTATPPATTCTVTSLTNGTAYTFTVTATNSVGIGPASTASSAVTPLGPAGAPTAVTATNADTTSSVSWTAPASTGGSAITGYTVTAVPSDGSANVLCISAASPCTLTGLTNGLSYSITIAATTAYGSGTASTAVTARPYPAAIMTAGRLVLWLDGADATTLLAASGCTGAEATTTVGCWKDKSTQANHAAQATSANRPTLATVSGRSVPSFDGTNDYLGMSPALLPTGTNPSTAFVAAQLTDPTPTTSSYRSALSWGTLTAGQTRDFYKTTTSASACVNTYSTGVTCAGTWSGTQVDILAGQHSAATVTGWFNGGAAAGPTSYAFATGTTGAAVGAELTGVQRWRGPVPEAIVFTGTLTASERRVLEDYLARKWAAMITPQAPTAVTGTAGTASAAISWTAPAWNGGSAVTSYTVTSSPGGFTCTAAAPATSCTVSGLTGGTGYTFTVTATNTVGTGPASTASATVTALGPPGAPTGVSGTAGDATSSVSWTAPASNGGSAITSYTVTAVPGTGGLPTVTCTAVSSPCALTGLVNGVDYSVSVTATNALGTGAASAATTVTPIPAVMASSGLKVWLDAQNAASLINSATCTGGTVSTGSAVLCWKDRSVSGWNAVRGSTSAVLTASAINGRRALRFVKTNPDYYSITSSGIGAVGSADRSLFAVTTARTTYGTQVTNNAALVAGWGGWNGGLLVKAYGGTTTVDTFQSDGYASSGPTLVPASTTVSTNPVIASTVYSSAGGTLTTGLALNGRGNLTTGSLAGTWYTHPDVFQVGSAGTPASASYAYPLDGDVGEVLVFNSALSAAQRRSVEEYLARRWGQAVAPGAPATAAATAGTGTATVTFTAPAWDGGAAVSSYTVAPTSGAGSCTWASGLSASCTGLTNGASYTFTVRATNSVGTGPVTTTAAVTP